MSAAHEAPAQIADLERAMSLADPAVLLLPPRLLRRVIKYHRHIAGLGLQVPHRRCYVIDRKALLQIASPHELGLRHGHEPPPTLLLIAHPNGGRAGALPPGEALLRCRRLLFHCRIHAAFEQQLADGGLTPADIRGRIERIGRTEFEEIRRVLQQENHLLPPGDDCTTYVEFAAVYLGLRCFDARLIPCYFPSLADCAGLDSLIAKDVDAATLFAGLGPEDVHQPTEQPKPHPERASTAPPAGDGKPVPPPGVPVAKLILQADRAAAVGNNVRAAILKAQAAPGPDAARVAGPGAELNLLARRLQETLALTSDEVVAWSAALPALLGRATRGFWTVEARLLYDLQKACVDHERGIYTADLAGWAVSLGRRPLRRPLPGQQRVRVVRDLRNASQRLLRARLPEADGRRLGGLLGAALRHSEERLRVHFRPLLRDALDEVHLAPANLPERVARHKLIEELLDRIVERGFLTLGDLRDALSSNQLKLPDLAGPAEFLRGDPLIRLNCRLAAALDGVYRGGEVYLRGLQRLSSLAFGTSPGRFLTRFVALPFGGAFVILHGLGHFVHLFGWHLHLGAPSKVLALGLFLFGLLHVPIFRRALAGGLSVVGRGLRAVLIDTPGWVLRQPLVRALMDSGPVALFRRYVLKPVLWTGGGVLAAILAGLDQAGAAWTGAGVFAAAVLFYNSRIGRDIEEALTDEAVRAWRRVSLDVFPALFHVIMDFFKQLLDYAERVLYAVDEWLRFKEGDGRLARIVKPVLGMIWGVLTYVVRFALTVLVEPQINPVKHFPVVTVAHKLLFPFIPVLKHVLEATLNMEGAAALTLATATIWSIPGLFGFLVWELKENWRLYQANRPDDLRPAAIGHHGETMLRLLRPGFHSGTIPRLYAKLRRAERRGKRRTVRKLRDALNGVERCIYHFVEREFLEHLRQSRGWGQAHLVVGPVHLATNRIRVELIRPEVAGGGTWLDFDERAGWIVARVARPGWLGELSHCQRQALSTALAGLYKLAGVSLTAEQVEADLRRAGLRVAVTERGLSVWSEENPEADAAYDFSDEPEVKPRVVRGAFFGPLPELTGDHRLFGKRPIRWKDWVEVWDRDQAGEARDAPFLAGASLLPEPK
jgi:hypothetical protein